jgi:hypothetical protein
VFCVNKHETLDSMITIVRGMAAGTREMGARAALKANAAAAAERFRSLPDMPRLGEFAA